MIVTEAEAFELYCPFKFSPKIKNPFCVHESCMAWRYLEIKNKHEESLTSVSNERTKVKMRFH